MMKAVMIWGLVVLAGGVWLARRSRGLKGKRGR
jgi:hypothetical protein